LFSTYAVLPSPLVKHPGNIIARLVNAILPSFGGLVAFIHKHPGLLGINAPGMMPYPYAYKLVTGERMNIGRFVRSGERIYNLERLVNIRQGLTSGDTLPKRLTDEAQEGGKPNSIVRLAPMLKKYYRIRGWDGHGAPTRKQLKKLGL
jgi:aldehyde:ferredoxin oxidoreductase